MVAPCASAHPTFVRSFAPSFLRSLLASSHTALHSLARLLSSSLASSSTTTTAMSSSYCFIRMPTGEALRVPVSGSMTVAEVKQRIIEMRPSFSPDSIRLIHAGAEMADRTPLHSYNLVAETTLHLVRSASRSPIKPSPASPAPATVPQRPRYQPLPRVDHSLPELPDYASALVFLWCTAAEHRPLASDAYGEPLPQQVQRGSIRPLCATCKNQCVEVDATSISWSQVFASSLQGQCLACDASCSIEWTFVCQGELALPTPDQRNICKAASLHMANHALPNLIFNTPARPEGSFIESQALSTNLARE